MFEAEQVFGVHLESLGEKRASIALLQPPILQFAAKLGLCVQQRIL
jgi:hypothetical protein